MEKDAAFSNDFPTDGVALRCFLVVSNYTRSLAFYRDVLGATVMRELAGTLCILSFAGSQILLSAPGGSAKDKPAVTDPPPLDHNRAGDGMGFPHRGFKLALGDVLDFFINC